MERFCLWLQRCYILGLLLLAWYVAPFTRFAPIFPFAWSLAMAASAFVIPAPSKPWEDQPAGSRAAQGALVGLFAGLAVGAADWSLLDATLFVELGWALVPLLLFDRFFGWAWSQLHLYLSSPSYR